MMKHSTQIDTIKFVFNEMSLGKAQQYLRALDHNDEQFSYMGKLIDLLSDIDDVAVEPSKSTVDAIIAYASNARRVIS